ncbi:multiprotein-bridging factor 1 family protein [Kitasatospora aureofaciens]|uniref:helix-turn-helix domain-containing protein n=1 Tax=Kitasatospora aureofaciens TaxID=1894 RepID=UPI003815B4B8
MPRSNNDQVPAAYVAAGQWPQAELIADAPASAHYGQAFARNLIRAMESTGHGTRTLSEKSGVAHTTISRLMRGRVLADMGTVARLEVALAVDLWPGTAAVRQALARRTPAAAQPATTR